MSTNNEEVLNPEVEIENEIEMSAPTPDEMLAENPTAVSTEPDEQSHNGVEAETEDTITAVATDSAIAEEVYAETADEEAEKKQTESYKQAKHLTPEQIQQLPISEPYIEIAKRCNLGVMRQRNEDTMFSFVALTGGSNMVTPFALGLVADGMGGHHGGDLASRTVSRMVGQQVLNRIYLPMLRDNSPPPISEVMLEAVEMANQTLYTPDPEKEGGTTLTAVLVVGQRLFLVHVGDSRAYLFNEDESTLQTITTDHSVVQRLQDAGQITAAEAEVHPHRNLLYRAMTGHELEIDTYTRSLPERGKVLICSDGLWGAIEPEQLTEIMSDASLSLQAQVDLLVETALLGGSTDNITAVVINFGY